MNLKDIAGTFPVIVEGGDGEHSGMLTLSYEKDPDGGSGCMAARLIVNGEEFSFFGSFSQFQAAYSNVVGSAQREAKVRREEQLKRAQEEQKAHQEMLRQQRQESQDAQ